MREYQKEHAKRKRRDPQDPRDPADSESDSEPSDPVGPSAPHAPDLYIFSNSLLPGILKIGRSKDVERRRAEMQRSQPFYINTVATFPGKGHLEASIHATFQASLVDGPGREWFRVSESDAIHAIAVAMRPS
jgi:hypothetical protein